MLPSRRSFLGAALASAATLASGRPLLAAPADPYEATDGATFTPNTLFLTWQRDPTTTMTVQWIGAVGEVAQTNVAYAPVKVDTIGAWPSQPAMAKPYPK